MVKSDSRETCRAKGSNAELRHYLARSARQSRCFSRCIGALIRAVKLSALPAVGCSSRTIARPVVLLPQPLSPTKPGVSPPSYIKRYAVNGLDIPNMSRKNDATVDREIDFQIVYAKENFFRIVVVSLCIHC